MLMKRLFGHTGELWPVCMGMHSDHIDILRLSQNIGEVRSFWQLGVDILGGLACVYVEAQ